MDYFSFSQLKMYEQCPRRFYWEYVCKRKPKKSLALAFGAALHSALEVFYREGDAKKSEETFINELLKADIQLKGKESIEKEARIGLNMLRKYFRSPERPYFNVKEVEYKFQTILKDPLTGRKLDLPVKGVMDLITKDDLIVDHKTSSSIWKMEDIETNLQAVCYWLAFESIFGREPLGFVFNFFIKRVNEPKFDAQPIQVDESLKLYFIEYAQYIVNQIRKKNFPQKIGRQCRYCPHRFICL